MYQIARIIPIYCPSTDGLTGHKAKLLPMTYVHERLAHKIAGRREARDFDNHGDDSFVVIRVGDSPFSQRRPLPLQPDEIWDLPF